MKKIIQHTTFLRISAIFISSFLLFQCNSSSEAEFSNIRILLENKNSRKISALNGVIVNFYKNDGDAEFNPFVRVYNSADKENTTFKKDITKIEFESVKEISEKILTTAKDKGLNGKGGIVVQIQIKEGSQAADDDVTESVQFRLNDKKDISKDFQQLIKKVDEIIGKEIAAPIIEIVDQ